jgi:hypothetical protein
MEVLLGLDPSPGLNKKLLQMDFSQHKEYINKYSYGKTWEDKVVNMFSIGIGITALLMYLLPEKSNVIRRYPSLRNLTNLSPFMRADIVRDIIKEYRDLNVYNVLVDRCEAFWDMFSSSVDEVPMMAPMPTATTEDLQRMVDTTERKVIVDCADVCSCSCKKSSSDSKTTSCKTSSNDSKTMFDVCKTATDDYSNINDFIGHMYEGMVHQVNSTIYPAIEQSKISALEAIKNSYDAVLANLDQSYTTFNNSLDTLRSTMMAEIERTRNNIIAQLEQYKTSAIEDINKAHVSVPLNATSLIATLNSQVTKLNEQYTLMNYRLTNLERYFEQIVPLLENGTRTNRTGKRDDQRK